MGSTVRSLVFALRTDSSGVTGFQETIQQSAAMTAQLKKDSESVAAARQKLRDVKSQKPGTGDDAAMADWKAAVAAQKAVVDGEVAMQGEHFKTNQLKGQLDRQYYASTLSDQDMQLQRAQLYYDSLAQKHAASAETMEKIDRTYAAKQASILGIGPAGMTRGYAEVAASERAWDQEKSAQFSQGLQKRLQTDSDTQTMMATGYDEVAGSERAWDQEKSSKFSQSLQQRLQAESDTQTMMATGYNEVAASERAFDQEKSAKFSQGLEKRLQAEATAQAQAEEFDQRSLKAREDNEEATRQYHHTQFQNRVNKEGLASPGMGGGGMGGGGFGQGWMRRMAGMEIGREFGNIMAPGLGDVIAPAGYFGAGGGMGLAAIGGGIAVLGAITAEVKDVRDGIKAARLAQIAFNEEIDKSNLKWGMLAEKTEKFSPFGEQGRSQFEAGDAAYIGAKAATQKAQVEYDTTYIFDRAERARLDAAKLSQRAANTSRFIAGRNLYGMNWMPGAFVPSVDNAFGGWSITDIERKRAAEDSALARQESSGRVEEARAMAQVSAMHAGPGQELARIQAEFKAKNYESGDKRIEEGLKFSRAKEDAERNLRTDFLNQNIDKKTGYLKRGYDVEKDPQYQDQLKRANDKLIQDDQTAKALQDDQDKRDGIERDADLAKQKIQKEDFDRKQGYELKQAQIAGEGDPFQRQIDQQAELNSEKHDEMALAGYTTEQIAKQDEIGDQILANLQKQLTYQESLLRMQHEMADIEHERARVEINQINMQSAYGLAQSGLSNEQRILEAQGMTRGAQQVGIDKEHNDAILAGKEAAAARDQAALAQKDADVAKSHIADADKLHNPYLSQQARDAARVAQDKADKARAEANADAVKAREADEKWQTDKQALQIEHERSVHNELNDVLDATAVAESRMTRLQAERAKYERDHPDERSSAELDALYAAKKQQLDADFEKTIEEKEISVASRRGILNPMQADYLRLKLDHPDVDDSLIRKMAMLDRVGQGDLSTRFTAGQTNFAALRGNINDNPQNITNGLLRDIKAIFEKEQTLSRN